MNSKERVLRTIQHRETDRIPFFFHGYPGISLGHKFGIEPEDSSAHMQLTEKLGCDVHFVRPNLKQNIPVEDEFWFSYGNVHSAIHGENAVLEKMPLEDAQSVEDIVNYRRWPNPDLVEYEIQPDVIPYLKDKAVVAHDMFILFLSAMGLRGMQNIMMDMAAAPEMAHAVISKISAINLERLDRFLARNQGIIDIAGIGDDVAGQNGILFSIDMWREYIKPYLRQAVDVCRKYKVIPYFHGCGGFTELFDEFSALGIQCVGRLQSEARGNDFAMVKEKYGSRFCLWGAIDAQHAVIEKNAGEVREYVRNIMNLGANGGGFIAGPTHTFTSDTPLANVIAVYETLRGEKF